MLLVFTLAAAAAIAVVAYERLRDRSPDATSTVMRTVRQLAGVVLALEGVVEALGNTRVVNARPPYGGPWSMPGGTSMTRPNLKMLKGGKEERPEWRFSIAATVSMRGRQDIAVRGITATADPRGYGHIAVRVGRFLVYLEDRAAYEALKEAVRRAGEYADAVYEPLDPPGVRINRR